MKILIDTNIVLDVFLKRQVFFEESLDCVQAIFQANAGYITSTQTKDIFYFLRKHGISAQDAKIILQDFTREVFVLDVTSFDVRMALLSDMDDYEDALIAYCSLRCGMTHVLTRNTKDFANSPIPAITPTKFLETIANG